MASLCRPYLRQIVCLQRSWRARKARSEFEGMMRSKQMTLNVLRHYLHLLDMRSEDFEQELLLQSLKGDITKAIRQNAQLEKDVDQMDVKIGLLVRYTCTLKKEIIL